MPLPVRLQVSAVRHAGLCARLIGCTRVMGYGISKMPSYGIGTCSYVKGLVTVTVVVQDSVTAILFFT